MKRCNWCSGKILYEKYHDEVWGVPEYDSQTLFTMLCLEGAQAGLNWYTILQKWDGYHVAFDNFDPDKIVQYNEQKIDELRQDKSIIRNKLKISSVITNAAAYIKMREEGLDLGDYLWSWVDNTPIINEWSNLDQVPAMTDISIELSKDLKKRGFKFVGPTIVYAFMQAVGMVNDHVVGCYRYKELS